MVQVVDKPLGIDAKVPQSGMYANIGLVPSIGVNGNYQNPTLRLSDRERESVEYANRVLAHFAISPRDSLLGAAYHRMLEDLAFLEYVNLSRESLDAAVLIGVDARIAAGIADGRKAALRDNILEYVKGEAHTGQMHPELQTFYKIAREIEGLVPREQNPHLYRLFAEVYAGERANGT
ncbi:MAG: hypothetical protein AABX34_00465, partial [Nanoarchaeota archaeon]